MFHDEQNQFQDIENIRRHGQMDDGLHRVNHGHMMDQYVDTYVMVCIYILCLDVNVSQIYVENCMIIVTMDLQLRIQDE